MRATLFTVSLLAQSIAMASTPDIATFTKDLQPISGFASLYYSQSNGKVYLQIPELDHPMLFQSSLPRGVGSNDIGLDRGQLGDTRLVQFERFGANVLLKQLNTQYRADSDNPAEQNSIAEAFASSVLAGLPIVAEQDGKLLVDYTDFLLSDIHGIAKRLNASGQGSFSLDKSRSGVFLPRTKAFVDNTELEALVTFKGQGKGDYIQQVTPDADALTVHLHHSFIRLPDDGYQPRAFHPYSGYWKISWQDYATAIDQPIQQRVIPRHRLYKQDPGAQRSKPVEPIVYYLDPGIPEPVMSALQEGASWWDQAFSAAGYDGAFEVRVLPEGADPMDVRYNVIQWVHRATRGWSYGSSVIDPRTGEIIKGHVTLGSLRVRQDYLIALGLTSPFDSPQASTEAQQAMALARIRQLAAHEVGHTLGIAHNFAASQNDRASVMDYPHPKITLKNGDIDLSDAYAVGIGEWDKYVISYGYQDYAAPEKEGENLLALVKQTQQQGMLYMSDPDARGMAAANADGHLWDNGSDAVTEFEHLLAVRRLALQKLSLDTLPQGTSVSELEQALVPIYLLHRYQLDAVARQIGGIHYQYSVKGDATEPAVRPVEAAQQRRAFEALLQTLDPTLLRLPAHLNGLLLPKAYGESRNRESFAARTGVAFDPLAMAESTAAYTLDWLLTPARLNRVALQHSGDWSTQQLLESLITRYVLVVANDDIAQRIQLVVLDKLLQTARNSEVNPEIQAAIVASLTNIAPKLSFRRDSNGRLMASWLAQFAAGGEWASQLKTKPLPPGSPI
ncbi:zinc-dependent metalloprotease [Bowmanella sp. JS7-9]|uniref:zinc-dependent metalloprotease n=1 Tax=Alteromonadaceae TaxID=72275 RepID=UPI00103AACEA|nr:zinc-dependent metalloprotease [Bowmanella sp. JS7-9]TBX25995.1 peptidase [Bowmanella sp. JS7-9]